MKRPVLDLAPVSLASWRDTRAREHFTFAAESRRGPGQRSGSRLGSVGLGLLFGLIFGGVGAALANPAASPLEGWRGQQGDHYATGWTVLLQGSEICLDPYVRPDEREIECRSRPFR